MHPTLAPSACQTLVPVLLLLLFGLLPASLANAQADSAAAGTNPTATKELQQLQQTLGVDDATFIAILPALAEHNKMARSLVVRLQKKRGPASNHLNGLRKADKKVAAALSKHLTPDQVTRYLDLVARSRQLSGVPTGRSRR